MHLCAPAPEWLDPSIQQEANRFLQRGRAKHSNNNNNNNTDNRANIATTTTTTTTNNNNNNNNNNADAVDPTSSAGTTSTTAAAINSSSTSGRFSLSASQFAHRLVVDPRSAEYLVTLWTQLNNHIDHLDLKCDVHPAAVPILANFFRDSNKNNKNNNTCAAHTVSIVANFLADGDFVDGTSLIDCLSEGLDGNISVKALHCDYYSFRYTQNAAALQKLLTGKRNLTKLVFNSCDFGSGSVQFLQEGLVAQTCLEEIRIITPEELEDAQTSQLIESLYDHCHDIKRICWCHLGNRSFRNMSRLIGRPGCQLEWVRIDGEDLFENSETVKLFQRALYQNGTLQRFTFVGDVQSYPRGLKRYVTQCNRRNQYIRAIQKKQQTKNHHHNNNMMFHNSSSLLFTITKLAKGSIIAVASPMYLIVRTTLPLQLMEHSAAARKRPRPT